MAALVVALGDRVLCELCTDVLTRGFNPDDDTLPIQLHTRSGNALRPDLDIIRKHSREGCRLCSELLHIFRTKVLNGYVGISRVEDAEEAVEIVAHKYPRISVDMVFDDEQEPFCYTLVYNFRYSDDGDDRSDSEVDLDAMNTVESDPTEDSKSPRMTNFGDAELDTEALLQVVFFFIGATCEYSSVALALSIALIVPPDLEPIMANALTS